MRWRNTRTASRWTRFWAQASRRTERSFTTRRARNCTRKNWTRCRLRRDVYKRDLQIERYNVPFLLNPFVSFYTSRGCPALCTFCMWPQTLSGHAWRTRSVDNVVAEVKRTLAHFPQMKEIFFDDDTFNIRKDRVIELSQKFKPLKFQWSCTAPLPQQV